MQDSSTRRRFIKAIKARIHRTEAIKKPVLDEATKHTIKVKRETMHTRSVMVSFDGPALQPAKHGMK